MTTTEGLIGCEQEGQCGQIQKTVGGRPQNAGLGFPNAEAGLSAQKAPQDGALSAIPVPTRSRDLGEAAGWVWGAVEPPSAAGFQACSSPERAGVVGVDLKQMRQQSFHVTEFLKTWLAKAPALPLTCFQ